MFKWRKDEDNEKEDHTWFADGNIGGIHCRMWKGEYRIPAGNGAGKCPDGGDGRGTGIGRKE